MKANVGIAIAPCALALMCAQSASAQGNEEAAPSYMRAPVRAPRGAFEIGITTGYTQGFGNIVSGRPVRETAGPGAGVGLSLGYRSSPGVGLGLTGGFEQYRAGAAEGRGTSVRGGAAGVEASFHLAPFERVDPVIRLGTGYRMLWTAPPGRNNDVLTHGFELGRLSLGLDIRVSDSIALGPSLGGGLNYFMWENPEGNKGNRALSDRRVNSFVFAGLGGRFDLGGHRQEKIIRVGGR
jgi:hypothetical protein